MKRLISCSLIVAVIIGFSLYGYYYSANATENIKSSIEALMQRFEEGDYDAAQKAAQDARHEWAALSADTIFVEDTECDNEIQMSIARINELCVQRDDEIYAECRVLQELLDSYISRQQPTPANIF